MSKSLIRRIEALEQELGGERRSSRRSASKRRKTLASELGELARDLQAMGPYMEEDVIVEDDMGMRYMDEVEELDVEPGMRFMDEMGMDDLEDDFEEEVVVEDDMGMRYMDDEHGMRYMEDEMMGCGGGAYMDLEASENSHGVEDEITQDSLSDVEKVAPGGDSVDVTAPSTRDVAPGSVAELVSEATGRLDRVATVLEKHGHYKMAHKIDSISESIEARYNGGC